MERPGRASSLRKHYSNFALPVSLSAVSILCNPSLFSRYPLPQITFLTRGAVDYWAFHLLTHAHVYSHIQPERLELIPLPAAAMAIRTRNDHMDLREPRKPMREEFV